MATGVHMDPALVRYASMSTHPPTTGLNLEQRSFALQSVPRAWESESEEATAQKMRRGQPACEEKENTN